MSKAQLRASQLLTTFGPGALMDLPESSIIVGGLDTWYYTGGQNPTIEEPRLIAKIRARLNNQLLTLKKPPVADDLSFGSPSGVTAWKFPEWFLVQDPEKTLNGTRRRLVHRSRLSDGKFKDKGKSYQAVPVRFVRACENGHVDDLDWQGYAHYYKKGCAGNLYMEEQSTTGEISKIFIVCSCGASRPLAHAARKKTKAIGKCGGRRPWLGNHTQEDCDRYCRLLTRSASNAYFPQLLSVISIPNNQSAVDEIVEECWDAGLGAVENLANLSLIRKIPNVAKRIENIADEQMMEAIDRKRQGIKKDVERPVKEAEFEILNDGKPEVGKDTPESDFFAKTLAPEKWQGPAMAPVEKVVLVQRLREVVALLGFTRFEAVRPETNGELPDELDLAVEPASLSLTQTWLPAIESRGEGIFLSLSGTLVEQWAQRPDVMARGNTLLQGFTQWQSTQGGKNRKFPGIQYYLLHTLAHSLMTAITLDCGYPASSIRERIYCFPGTPVSPGRYGLLIHTSSNDAEGTLGGLVEAGRRIQYFFRRALEMAELCSNDPVCAHHIPTQHDPAPLLGSACHGCMLVPETSCEQQNAFLDRGLLVSTLTQSGVQFFKNA